MEQKFYKEYKITQWKFWQNFWEYYKLHVFFMVLVIAMVVVGVRSCMSRVEDDLKVTFIGGDAVLSADDMEPKLKEWAQDLDGDGKVTVDIFSNTIADNDTIDMAVTVLNRIDADLIAGEPFILMADAEYIGRFVKMAALEPLDETVFGLDIPEENVLRDPVTNEIVAVDISKMPVSEITGDKTGAKIYLGMKVMPESKADNEKYIKMHNQSINIIRKMLEYK